MKKLLKKYTIFIFLLIIGFFLSVYSAKFMYDLKRANDERIEKRLEKALKEVKKKSKKSLSQHKHQQVIKTKTCIYWQEL